MIQIIQKAKRGVGMALVLSVMAGVCVMPYMIEPGVKWIVNGDSVAIVKPGHKS
jgi:hypothetical protein